MNNDSVFKSMQEQISKEGKDAVFTEKYTLLQVYYSFIDTLYFKFSKSYKMDKTIQMLSSLSSHTKHLPRKTEY